MILEEKITKDRDIFCDDKWVNEFSFWKRNEKYGVVNGSTVKMKDIESVREVIVVTVFSIVTNGLDQMYDSYHTIRTLCLD